MYIYNIIITYFRWTHKKRVVHNELISPIHKSPQKFKPQISQILTTPTVPGSETLLPRMEPHVLAGHTPRLVVRHIIIEFYIIVLEY